jgi:hypothetical protein
MKYYGPVVVDRMHQRTMKRLAVAAMPSGNMPTRQLSVYQATTTLPCHAKRLTPHRHNQQQHCQHHARYFFQGR